MRLVTVTGGTLFALAALWLNDATQWVRIARANNLSDPMLSGPVTLRIPPAQSSASPVPGVL